MTETTMFKWTVLFRIGEDIFLITRQSNTRTPDGLKVHICGVEGKPGSEAAAEDCKNAQEITIGARITIDRQILIVSEIKVEQGRGEPIREADSILAGSVGPKGICIDLLDPALCKLTNEQTAAQRRILMHHERLLREDDSASP